LHFNKIIPILILSLAFIINGCSNKIYDNYSIPLLDSNKVSINGEIKNNEPIEILIQPVPNKKIFGIPLGLSIYNIAKNNPDSLFDNWLSNNPKRVNRLNKFLSNKQVIQLKRYNRIFNNWIKSTGEEPVFVTDADIENNSKKLIQYYKNNGYFDVKVEIDSVVKNNKAEIVYKIDTDSVYRIDTVNYNIIPKEIDSLVNSKLDESFIKSNEPFTISKLIDERDRIIDLSRDNGVYNFQQRSINYKILIDSSGTDKKIPIIVNIGDLPRSSEDTINDGYSIKKINEIKVYVESIDELSNINSYTDTTTYRGVDIFSKGSLKYSPKSLTEPIFFDIGSIYSEKNKILTSRYYSNLANFKYPSILFEENGDNLSSSIYLIPRKRFSLGFNLDLTHSNIEDFGISVGSILNIRNIFRGTENLSINLKNSIGASKDIGIPNDSFFNLFELGGNLNLRIPRVSFPINLNSFISKEMNPITNINIGTTVQKNIGLDKQYYNGIYEIGWSPTKKSKLNVRIFDFEYVNNNNISNYFNVYRNSYDKLNYISSIYNIDQSLINENGDLIIPEGSDTFINSVLNNETTIQADSDIYRDVVGILERKERLTENNIIVGSSLIYNINSQESILDEDFYQFRWKIETVGNLFNEILRKNNSNNESKVEISGVSPSQYFKSEFNYIKHLSLTRGDVLAFRAFAGIAIPFGNSENIPFSRSYYSGGSNDNRAWKAYKLGPGSSNNYNEFNEANFKLAFNLEYRTSLFGKFKGALFMDVGNIWNVFDDVEDPAMKFDGLQDLNELAIGSGFGIRYDFNFFVIRLDVGFKTYNPSYEVGSRWLKDYNIDKAVFNIGINYPF
tara:strand:- start:494 stop:3025 length:2532 start_codon:yes stop_codon:yes gene_type:complete